MHEVEKKKVSGTMSSVGLHMHIVLAMLPFMSKRHTKRVLLKLAEKNTTCTSDAVH